MSSGRELDIYVETSTVPVELKPLLKKKFASIVHRFGESENFVEESEFHEYTTIVRNTGKNKVVILFSEWEIVHSPYHDAIGGFSFSVGSNKTKIIRFVANDKPRKMLSAMNVGERHGFFRRRFSVLAGGQAVLYVPRPLALSDKYFVPQRK